MKLKEIIERITSLKNELESYRPISVEHEKRIMQKFRLEWNYNSNHIEGNQLDYGETKALILFGITAQGKPLKDHIEIKGHNEALLYIEEVIKQERPLTESFIRELHEIILKEPYEVDAITTEGNPTKKLIKVGEYKSTPNHVKTNTGEIFRFASVEETPAKMEELINWYREQFNRKETDSFLLATEFHYRFVRIHPFDDGNGRMARILMNFILMQKGFPPIIVEASKKAGYYSALAQADSGNLEALYEYLGVQLIKSLELMISGAKGKSIEEDDDLDKRIALIQLKLNNVNEEEATEKRSKKNVRFLVEFNILPLVELLDSKLDPIKTMFNEHTFHFYINGLGTRFEGISDLRAAIEDDSIYEDHQRDLSVSYWFNGLKKAGTKAFNQNIGFKIEFNDWNFIIKSEQGGQNLFEGLYHHVMNTESIKKIANKIAGELIERIEQRVDQIGNRN